MEWWSDADWAMMAVRTIMDAVRGCKSLHELKGS
jgi:hypothetical protein